MSLSLFFYVLLLELNTVEHAIAIFRSTIRLESWKTSTSTMNVNVTVEPFVMISFQLNKPALQTLVDLTIILTV